MKKLLLCAMIVYAALLSAQNTSAPDTYTPSTGLRASIVRYIPASGFKVGIERPYRVVRVDHIKPKRVRTVIRERFWVYNLAAYHHPFYHNSVTGHIDWQIRRQYPSGFLLESAFGGGLSRTFLLEDTYRQSAGGEFKKVAMAGDFYLMGNVGLGAGYNWALHTRLPIITIFRPGVMVNYPFSSLLYPRPTFDLTVVYKNNNIWPSNVRKNITRTKNKKS